MVEEDDIKAPLVAPCPKPCATLKRKPLQHAATMPLAEVLEEGMLEEVPKTRLDHVPLLGEEIVIDDHHATLVMVFPKCVDKGGTVDPEEIIANPKRECEKIFFRHHNLDSFHTVRSGFDGFKESISAAMYHDVVRAKVLWVLQESGIRAETFESLDGNEVFVKLSLKHNGEVIKRLAQRYEYKMPFTPEAYKGMERSGSYPGERPMKNANGEEVPAYTEFEFALENDLMPFRQVDAIRMIQLRLDEWLNISEMVKQNVISRYFAAARYANVIELHKNWATLWKILRLPNYAEEHNIRDYFGESVAFFFNWYTFYTHMLVPLACLGLLCAARKVEAFHISIEKQRYVQFFFGCVLVVWASVFNELFKNLSARAKQCWGMKDYDAITLELSSYDPSLEGTWKLWFKRGFANVAAVLYCLSFAGVIFLLEWRKAQKTLMAEAKWLSEKESGGDIAWQGSLKQDDATALEVTILIKVASLLWSKLAPRLVNLQNHRTQARWNNALTYCLTSVKLFVALFPFLEIAFVTKYKHATCAKDLAHAAFRLYGHGHNWPEGVPKPGEGSHGSASLEGTLKGFYYRASNETCFYGCYPVRCFDQLDGQKVCITNCVEQLETGLFTFYLTHIASTVIFLVIPFVLIQWQVKKEHEKAKQQAGELSDAPYSFMQLQAKCHDLAPYEYYSWGGSLCEDFLELAIGYALLTCFGIALPIMSVVAFFSAVVEYRLLAYRMTNITCRPMPLGSEGIGTWQEVFELISTFAVAVNVGFVVFIMPPMRTWDWGHQVLAFAVLEHIMLFLRGSMDFAIPDEPQDVQRIEDFNVRFKRKFVKHERLEVPKSERYSMMGVDISLGVPWV